MYRFNTELVTVRKGLSCQGNKQEARELPTPKSMRYIYAKKQSSVNLIIADNL